MLGHSRPAGARSSCTVAGRLAEKIASQRGGGAPRRAARLRRARPPRTASPTAPGIWKPSARPSSPRCRSGSSRRRTGASGRRNSDRPGGKPPTRPVPRRPLTAAVGRAAAAGRRPWCGPDRPETIGAAGRRPPPTRGCGRTPERGVPLRHSFTQGVSGRAVVPAPPAPFIAGRTLRLRRPTATSVGQSNPTRLPWKSHRYYPHGQPGGTRAMAFPGNANPDATAASVLAVATRSVRSYRHSDDDSGATIHVDSCDEGHVGRRVSIIRATRPGKQTRTRPSPPRPTRPTLHPPGSPCDAAGARRGTGPR
jgi:hypothetical protein